MYVFVEYALKDYPDTLLNNRHTDLIPHTGSGHYLSQTGEHTQTDKQTLPSASSPCFAEVCGR